MKLYLYFCYDLHHKDPTGEMISNFPRMALEHLNEAFSPAVFYEFSITPYKGTQRQHKSTIFFQKNFFVLEVIGLAGINLDPHGWF